MNTLRIKAIKEADFDEIISAADGHRIEEEGAADYRIGDSLIELKLIEEEGFDKTSRQEKLAKHFRSIIPDVPVVSLNSDKLNQRDLNAYCRIVEGPIKTAVKKASKQLGKTNERGGGGMTRVLVMLNVGYTLLSDSEFKKVCLKCVRNDSSKIDSVVCGGIYFASDGFDNYVVSHLENFPINIERSFDEKDDLNDSWDKFLHNMMKEAITCDVPVDAAKYPIVDLIFELDGVRYVKPSPALPSSSFYPDGCRPRANSTGINECPPVACTFPRLSKEEWLKFKAAMPDAWRLKSSYSEWIDAFPSDEPPNLIRPLVPVEVDLHSFLEWAEQSECNLSYGNLGEYTTEILQQKASELIQSAKEYKDDLVVGLEYIFLIVNEIGNDKANDYVSIYYVCEINGFERREVLVENVRIFFEHGVALCASYALIKNVDMILYRSLRAD
jgi:hypothetical protein